MCSRHIQPVRGVQHRGRHGDLQSAPTPPRDEFKKFLAKINDQVLDDLGVHLICDNHGTNMQRRSTK